MPESLSRRNVAVASGLFVAAFAATLAYTNAGSLAGKVAELVRTTRANAAPPASITSVQTSAVASDTAPSVAEEPASIAVPTPRAPTALEMQTFTRLQEQIRSEEGEERGDALRRLGSIPGPQAVLALGQSLREDADVRNRLIAVSSLQSLAERFGDEQWLVRDALRLAMDDQDELLATQARAAHDTLLKKLGAQR